jgi:hypothetical protein
MKTNLRRSIFALGAMVCFCTPAPRQNGDAKQVYIPAENQRLWLAPIVNKTRVEDLQGWPRDSLEKAILLRRFDDIGQRLLSEFRRCEKYGLYTMADDSGSATMRIFVTLDGYTRTKDTLTLPVFIHVEFPSRNKVYDFTFYPAAGGVTGKKGSGGFHYAGDLVAELCASFPYRQAVYRFYSTMK